MSQYKTPFFRRIIVPWYDTTTACVIVILFTCFGLFFGIIGISAAGENAEFRRHLWIAVLIALLSAGVLVSTAIRLIKRHLDRISKH